MEPTTNTLGVAHENGDVEQSHRRFEAVDQALRVRTAATLWTAAYPALRTWSRIHPAARWAEEQAALRPPPLRLVAERVPVSRFSTIQVLRNTYSVPARLIGTTVLVRVRAEVLEVYRGTAHLLTMPRLLGHGQHRIDYRHVIWSLVRKPGAFAQYRYRDDLYPSLAFRRAYDALCASRPQGADRDYVRLLHLAASTSEADVTVALELLLDQRQLLPSVDAVRDLARPVVRACHARASGGGSGPLRPAAGDHQGRSGDRACVSCRISVAPLSHMPRVGVPFPLCSPPPRCTACCAPCTSPGWPTTSPIWPARRPPRTSPTRPT
jgi:hypothetical protein